MTEIGYTQVGDYLLPNIKLNEPPEEVTVPLGKYGMMRKAFLKKHQEATYTKLLLSEKLFPHLREVDEQAAARMEQMMNTLTVQTSLPDKATDQMGWAAAMNALKAQAEEMVLNELIYA